jgi:hypothetical protein
MKDFSLLAALVFFGASMLEGFAGGGPSFAGLLAAKSCFWMLIHIKCKLDKEGVK